MIFWKFDNADRATCFSDLLNKLTSVVLADVATFWNVTGCVSLRRADGSRCLAFGHNGFNWLTSTPRTVPTHWRTNDEVKGNT